MGLSFEYYLPPRSTPRLPAKMTRAVRSRSSPYWSNIKPCVPKTALETLAYQSAPPPSEFVRLGGQIKGCNLTFEFDIDARSVARRGLGGFIGIVEPIRGIGKTHLLVRSVVGFCIPLGIGPGGVTTNIGKHGTHTTYSIPGTGISYRTGSHKSGSQGGGLGCFGFLQHVHPSWGQFTWGYNRRAATGDICWIITNTCCASGRQKRHYWRQRFRKYAGLCRSPASQAPSLMNKWIARAANRSADVCHDLMT